MSVNLSAGEFASNILRPSIELPQLAGHLGELRITLLRQADVEEHQSCPERLSTLVCSVASCVLGTTLFILGKTVPLKTDWDDLPDQGGGPLNTTVESAIGGILMISGAIILGAVCCTRCSR